MSLNVSGSLRKLFIDGVSFNIAGDVDIDEKFSKYETDSIAGSGVSMKKMVRISVETSDITLLTNAEERSKLKEYSERVENYPMSYTNAAGDTYRSTGFIKVDSNKSADNRTTISMVPENDWEVFTR